MCVRRACICVCMHSFHFDLCVSDCGCECVCVCARATRTGSRQKAESKTQQEAESFNQSETIAPQDVLCYDTPSFKDAHGKNCDFYHANPHVYCQRSGELGTLAFTNKEGMDASRACCACGGGTPNDPTPTMYDSDGGYTCSGTLIHPRWVLTSAHCASNAKRVALAGAEGCAEQLDVARVLVHPGYEYGGDYDVGLLHLATPSSVPPVQMYEGGDLGFSDCNALQYLVALAAVEEGMPLVMRLEAMDNGACNAEVEAREGFQRVTR